MYMRNQDSIDSSRAKGAVRSQQGAKSELELVLRLVRPGHQTLDPNTALVSQLHRSVGRWQWDQSSSWRYICQVQFTFNVVGVFFSVFLTALMMRASAASSLFHISLSEKKSFSGLPHEELPTFPHSLFNC